MTTDVNGARHDRLGRFADKPKHGGTDDLDDATPQPTGAFFAGSHHSYIAAENAVREFIEYEGASDNDYDVESFADYLCLNDVELHDNAGALRDLSSAFKRPALADAFADGRYSLSGLNDAIRIAEAIDRDQAVDDDGSTLYDGYILTAPSVDDVYDICPNFTYSADEMRKFAATR